MKIAEPIPRLLLEGERPCEICGAGLVAHREGQTGHPFTPPEWTDFGYPPLMTWRELNNRGFWGRLKWVLVDR